MSPRLARIREWVDRRRPRTFLGYFLWAFYLFLVLFGIRAVDRWMAVSRIIDRVDRNREIEFWYAGRVRPHGRPYEKLENLIWFAGEKLAPGQYVDAPNYAQKLAATWSGETTELMVYDFSGFKPGFGQALSAYRRLRVLRLVDSEITTVANSEGVFESIAKMKRLHTLVLYGYWITDERLESIAHLQEIEILHLSNSRLTARSVETVRKFPKLKELYFNSWVELPVEELEKLKKERPQITIRYGDNELPYSPL